MIGHKIYAQVWRDENFDNWNANIRFTEFRNEGQYGASVVVSLKSNAGTSYDVFMRKVRRQAIRDINTLWT